MGEERCCKKRKLNGSGPCRNFASIERLPLELLELIFVESKNVNLLYTSKQIRLQLSSDSVRRRLILRCFQSSGLNTDDFDPSLEPSIGRMDRATSTCDESYEDAIRNLTALLNESWLTMTIVKETVVSWMWQRAHTLLKAALKEYGFPASDYEPAHKALRETLEKSTSTMTLADIDYFRRTRPSTSVDRAWSIDESSNPWLFSWSNPHASLKICMNFLENPWHQSTALGYLRCMVLARDSEPVPTMTCRWGKEPDWNLISVNEQRFINWTSSYRILPPRLLAGPWSQDRGDLFKFCLDQCTDVCLDTENELSPMQTQAAQLGLSRAIKDGNFLAVYMLLGRCSASCQSTCTHYVLAKGFVSDANMPAQCPSVENPFRHLSWDQTITRALAIPIRTEHLEQCLDNYAFHPAASLQFLDCLANRDTEVPVLPPNFLARFKESVVTRHPDPSYWCNEAMETSEWRLLREFEASLGERASSDQGANIGGVLSTSKGLNPSYDYTEQCWPAGTCPSF